MRYIALLRGINVGGQKKLLMKDLRSLFVAMGFEEVQTYIQSGNVIFTSEISESLEQLIFNGIRERFGWEVPVLVRTRAEIEKILLACPFSEEKKLQSYFTLLQYPPTTAAVREANAYQFEGEEFLVTSQCVYFYSEMGYAKTKLNNNWLERQLKVPATSRNYRTLSKLMELSKD